MDDGNAYISKDGLHIWQSEWQPDLNIGQAMMCLDNFDDNGWEIFVEGDVKKVMIFDTDGEILAEIYAREEANSSIALAISVACAKATGWEKSK